MSLDKLETSELHDRGGILAVSWSASHLGLDVLGSLSISQSVVRLFKALAGWADVGYHYSTTVPS